MSVIEWLCNDIAFETLREKFGEKARGKTMWCKMGLRKENEQISISQPDIKHGFKSRQAITHNLIFKTMRFSTVNKGFYSHYSTADISSISIYFII